MSKVRQYSVPAPAPAWAIDSPARVRASRRARRASGWRFLALVLWWSGAVFAAIAIAAVSPVELSVATAMLSMGFMADDVARASRGGITPITVFAFTGVVIALANGVAFLNADTRNRGKYFIYATDDYLYFAALLTFAGTLLTIGGFRLVAQDRRVRALGNWMPPLTVRVSDQTLMRWGPAIGVLGILMHLVRFGSSLGALSEVLLIAPQLVIFSLARSATSRKVKGAMEVAVILACLEGLRAFFYAYLRSDILSPFAALLLGSVMGSRSLAPLKRPLFIPIYGLIVVFAVYFTVFAQVRSTAGTGVDRLRAVAATAAVDAQTGSQAERPGVVARVTTFNQLSRIGQIYDQDGPLNGQTLQYLGFVFVPRFIWPNKPIVQKGGWFAWRIGQAWIEPDGTYSNSVNMTIPGELYLNYGWWGVLVGCPLFGTILAMFWKRTSFWSKRPSELGTSFGFYLLWFGVTLSADLQILVTILATYLTLVAMSLWLRTVRLPRHLSVALPINSTNQ